MLIFIVSNNRKTLILKKIKLQLFITKRIVFLIFLATLTFFVNL